MIKKAMILAAGFGKRIHPLTLKCPKPLLKIGNETLLSNTIKFIEKFGIKEVVINVHYLKEQIIEYLGKNQFNLKIHIVSEESSILGTGGGVVNAINYFSKDPFLVINPDTLWSSNYIEELKLMEKLFFDSQKKCALLVSNKNNSFDKTLKGDFNLSNNKISRNANDNLSFIYTGLQIMNPNVFNNLKNNFFSMNLIWDKLTEENNLIGYESKNEFLHVSTLKIYNLILNKKIKH